MSHEGTGIESIVIIVSEDEDIVEIIKLESFKAEGQLNGGGADENGHFSGLFHFYIMEVLGMLEEISAEKEFSLFFQAQPVIVVKITSDDGVIESLLCDEAFKLMSGV
jgi:hypothetical protein